MGVVQLRIRHLLIGLLFLGPLACLGIEDRSVKTNLPPKIRKRSAEKLIEWVGLGWLDQASISGEGAGTDKQTEDLNAVLNKLKNARGNSGKDSGAKSGSGSGKLIFNDNAAKGSASGSPSEQQGEGDPGDRGGKPPGGGGNGGQDKPIVFDKYWPMCIFLDPIVSDAEANEIVKGTVDKAGACGVNLFVVPVTIKTNYPKGSPDLFNPMQQSSCNMQSIGVSEASTLLVNPDPDAAAKMCNVPQRDAQGNIIGWDRGVAGCAQVRAGGGISREQQQLMGSNQSNGGFASGGIIPSVIVPIGWNSGVASHEAIGHSQMGWPNLGESPDQQDAGLGIGTPSKGNSRNENTPDIYTVLLDRNSGPQYAAGPEGGGVNGGWTGIGCAQMRARALPNTKKFAWTPSQKVYTIVEKDPQKQWQLGQPLWGPVPPNAPPSAPPKIANEPRGQPTLDDEKLFFDDGAKKGDSVADEIDGRHKKKKGDSGGDEMDRLLTSLRKRSGSGGGDPLEKGKVPPGGLKKGSGASLTFDEDAKKADGTTPGSGAGGAGGSGGSGSFSGGDGSGLTFDENAAKGSASSSNPDGSIARNPSSLNGPGGAGANKLGAGLRSESSLDEGFFNSIIKSEEKARRRTKGATLREKLKSRSSTARGRPEEK